jgi:hypothetical protein
MPRPLFLSAPERNTVTPLSLGKVFDGQRHDAGENTVKKNIDGAAMKSIPTPRNGNSAEPFADAV